MTVKNVAPRSMQGARMASVLCYFGVRQSNRRTAWTASGRPYSGLVSKLPEGKLWELYEATKKSYRERIGKAHPDRAGTHEEAATLNAAWERTEMLFKRLGIG